MNVEDLKFRAWNNDELLYSQDYIRLEVFFCITDDQGYDKFKTIYTRFTGLFDKNGVEIYEGDIFKKFDPIIYSNDRARFEAHLPGARIFSLDEFYENGQKPIVIGNIFENPELLN